LLLRTLLRRAALPAAANCAGRSTPCGAFTRIIISNFANQRTGCRTADSTPCSGSGTRLLCRLLFGFRLLLVSFFLLRQLKGIGAGIANGPFITSRFVFGLLRGILTLSRKNEYIHRRTQRLRLRTRCYRQRHSADD
jgi:hypothetical protein